VAKAIDAPEPPDGLEPDPDPEPEPEAEPEPEPELPDGLELLALSDEPLPHAVQNSVRVSATATLVSGAKG